MKIIYIIPGSGGTFYCQNCMRDNLLAEAMKEAGHDVIIIPMYLPMFSDSDEEDNNSSPIFFGAVNLYLKSSFPILNKIPNWLCKLFDSRWLLKLAAKKSGSTSASGLEEMTLDLLRCKSDVMNDELEKLINWLEASGDADIIHISNALLLGIVKKLKERLNIPIVCSLQDEDQWVESMRKPFIDKVWNLISECSKDVDSFFAVSDYYGTKMGNILNIPKDKIKIVHIGIKSDDYHKRSGGGGNKEPRYNHRGDRRSTTKPTCGIEAIGFMSKITESLGFAIVAEAFYELKQSERFKNLKLYASGGVTQDNIKFINSWKKRFKKDGFDNDFIIVPEFDKLARVDFFNKISILSVPVIGGEAFGTYLIEAMASGVAVVQPEVGASKEIIDLAGGGVTYTPNTSTELANAWRKLLEDKETLSKLSINGELGVKKYFDISCFVKNVEYHYKQITNH